MEKLEKEGWVKTEKGTWRNPSAPFMVGCSESDALKIQAMIDQWDQEEKYYPEDRHKEIRQAEIERINRLSVQKLREERFGDFTKDTAGRASD